MNISKKEETQCRHKFELDPDYGEQFCIKCYVVDGAPLRTEKSVREKENLNVIYNPIYDRTRWIENLPYLLGQKNHELTDDTWLDIVSLLPNPFLWQDAYYIFRQFNLQDYWICLPSFLGLSLPISNTVIQNVTKFIYLSNHSRYKINYLFLVYKFVQIESKTSAEVNIPMHRTQRWIVKTDKWWKSICRKNQLPFHESNMAYVHFDKDALVDKLTKSIERYHLLNSDVSEENFQKYIKKFS